VTSNVAGFDFDTAKDDGAAAAGDVGTVQYIRSAADQMFYTVMYCIAIYMMALSSFKLIDLIPANFLRWLNSSAGFNENLEDPAQGIVNYAYVGSQSMLNRGQGLLNVMMLRNS
jgi:hypothetical protein